MLTERVQETGSQPIRFAQGTLNLYFSATSLPFVIRSKVFQTKYLDELRGLIGQSADEQRQSLRALVNGLKLTVDLVFDSAQVTPDQVRALAELHRQLERVAGILGPSSGTVIVRIGYDLRGVWE